MSSPETRFNAIAVMFFIAIPMMQIFGPPPPLYYWPVWALSILALWKPTLSLVRRIQLRGRDDVTDSGLNAGTAEGTTASPEPNEQEGAA